MRRLLANRWAPWVIVAGLALALALEIVAATHHNGGSGLPRASAAETQVARDFAVAVTSFDYRHVDADTAHVLSFADPGYRPDLLRALGPSFTSGVTNNKRVSVGSVTAGPVVQALPDRKVVFLVVLTQQVTSAGSTSAPSVSQVVLLVTVTRGPQPKVQQVQVL